jgi:hypothetical protein
MNQHRLELADVFRTHEADFLAVWGSVLPPPQKKALRDIRDCRTAVLAVVYKLRALDCGRELPGIEPSSVIPLTVNNLEAKSAYRSRRFYPALMYDLDMRVALTPLSGPVPYAGVGVSAQ